jgi:DNA polymerase III subunit gamma/tau
MSYLVLARKSRPQTFAEVVGQRPVVQTLQNSIRRDRVAHAILFSGVRGVGKTTLARIMAKALNCQADLELRPCGQCPFCREIAAGNALDLHEIDGASNRGIQEIRELKEKIRFLPTSAKYKIIIIDEVHMLTTEAFNALLKTLEEPPAHVYFMFATTEIHKIPITILSRCQQYELKRVPAGELQAHFLRLAEEEGYTVEPAAMALIVREAAGSIRDGLSLLDQMFSFGEKHIRSQDVIEVLGLVGREVLLRLTRALLEGNRGEVFLSLNAIFGYGIDSRRFLEDLMDNFRCLLLCKIDGCSMLIDRPEEELEELAALAATCSHETLHLQLSLLMAIASELKNSAQPKLTLETSLLKILEAGNVVPVSTLLGRLDEILAKGLPHQPGPLPAVEGPPTVATEKKNLTASPPAGERSTPLTSKVEPAKPQPEQTRPVPPDPPQDKTASPAPATPGTTSDPGNPPPSPAPPIHSHSRDVRRDWPLFIGYVKERKEWMAQGLQLAENPREDPPGELQLSYLEATDCALLRQKDNLQILTEFALDFFQKPLKVRIRVADAEPANGGNGEEGPQRKRQLLANDPLVLMATEIFNGQVGDIRIGPKSR